MHCIAIQVLIVPFGIEICHHRTTLEKPQCVLIVPFGIEIRQIVLDGQGVGGC